MKIEAFIDLDEFKKQTDDYIRTMRSTNQHLEPKGH